MRRVPDIPRTRVEEMLRARGLTQAAVIARTGWNQTTVNKIVIGKSNLTPHSSAVLARLCHCDVSELYRPLGAPIPKPNTNRIGMDVGEEYSTRMAVILRLLGAPDLAALLRFITMGDLSALPPPVAIRFKEFLDEEQLRLSQTPLDEGEGEGEGEGEAT